MGTCSTSTAICREGSTSRYCLTLSCLTRAVSAEALGHWTRSAAHEEHPSSKLGSLHDQLKLCCREAFCSRAFDCDFEQAVHLTIQNLIRAGMNPKTENNPYKGKPPHTSKHQKALVLILPELAWHCG